MFKKFVILVIYLSWGATAQYFNGKDDFKKEIVSLTSSHFPIFTSPLQDFGSTNQYPIYLQSDGNVKKLAGYLNNNQYPIPAPLQVDNSESVVHPVHHSTIIRHEPYVPSTNQQYLNYNPSSLQPLQHPLAKPHVALAPVTKYYLKPEIQHHPPAPNNDKNVESKKESVEETEDDDDEEDEEDAKPKRVENDEEEAEEDEEGEEEPQKRGENIEEDEQEEENDDGKSDEEAKSGLKLFDFDDHFKLHEKYINDYHEKENPKYKKHSREEDDEEEEEEEEEEKESYKKPRKHKCKDYDEDDEEEVKPKYRKDSNEESSSSKANYDKFEKKQRPQRPQLSKFNYQPYTYSKGDKGRPNIEMIPAAHSQSIPTSQKPRHITRHGN